MMKFRLFNPKGIESFSPGDSAKRPCRKQQGGDMEAGRARHSVRAAGGMWSAERRARSDAPYPAAAFTLTELLVVIAILALLAATQLPALTGAKSPISLTHCMNNLRQIGQATMLYKSDNNDCHPIDDGHPLTSMTDVANPRYWARKLLGYMGGYTTNIQPASYICPNETNRVVSAPFQLHFQANNYLFTEGPPTTGYKVRGPFAYWMIMEKSAAHYGSIRTGGLITDYLMSWNTSGSISTGMRRHSGNCTAAAADGHAEWLRMHPYQPGRPAPLDFLELGDCYMPPNSQLYAPYWSVNNTRAKLFCRDRVGGTF